MVCPLGSLHVLALSEDGEIYAWGDNDEGQLGDGTQHPISRPRPIAALKVDYDSITLVLICIIQLCDNYLN